MSLLGPADGVQACGDTGPGRMLEPELIAEGVAGLFQSDIQWRAGGDYRRPDPRSHRPGALYLQSQLRQNGLCSGHRRHGSRRPRHLIRGPVNLPDPDRIQCLRVESAREMLEASLQQLGECDIFIAAAAVADYRPPAAGRAENQKSAASDTLELTLIKKSRHCGHRRQS